ncbi:MAG: hypothetical protein Q9195_000196 [Heterodermia aff. obscurata]
MIEKADGQSCQATNFLKAFGSIPEARRLAIAEDASNQPQNTLEARIQSASRFLLEQIALDARRISDVEFGRLVQYFCTESTVGMHCMNCRHETFRTEASRSIDLFYKRWNIFSQSTPTFAEVLIDSFNRETERRGFCNRCKKYAPIVSRPQIRSIPSVLILNTGLENNADKRELWATPGWLPVEIGLVYHGQSVMCFEGEGLRNLRRTRHNPEPTIYELVGFVADINSGERQKSHLVSLVNVAMSDQEPADQDRWHLFNDFLVRQVPQEDHTDDSRNGWVLNPEHEAPQAGTHVAIDSEFVALQQAEIEIRADGDREVIRPTRLGLARVSVLRGSGMDEGIPFINDYITVNEPVVDYLTQYSGLSEGDLDARTSSHVLVPLKHAYKKLWLLLNLGCIFVGHGLPSDFRTINIHVPKSQVLDTVTLFHLQTQKRKLSLRFLSWYFLKEDIQGETHDSIEDAITALKLWRKYEEFKDAGIVSQMLEEVYHKGRKYGYKPPSEGQSGRLTDGRSTDISSSGRATPTMFREAASGPQTPVSKKVGRDSEYFESPLR